MNKIHILSIGFISALVTTNATAMLILSSKQLTHVPQKRNIMYLEDRNTMSKRDISKKVYDYRKAQQRSKLYENIRQCDERIENYIGFCAKHTEQYKFHKSNFNQKATVYGNLHDAIEFGFSGFPRLQKFLMPSPDEALAAYKAQQQAKKDMDITKLHLNAAYAEKIQLLQQLRYIE